MSEHYYLPREMRHFNVEQRRFAPNGERATQRLFLTLISNRSQNRGREMPSNHWLMRDVNSALQLSCQPSRIERARVNSKCRQHHRPNRDIGRSISARERFHHSGDPASSGASHGEGRSCEEAPRGSLRRRAQRRPRPGRRVEPAVRAAAGVNTGVGAGAGEEKCREGPMHFDFL